MKEYKKKGSLSRRSVGLWLRFMKKKEKEERRREKRNWKRRQNKRNFRKLGLKRNKKESKKRLRIIERRFKSPLLRSKKIDNIQFHRC